MQPWETALAAGREMGALEQGGSCSSWPLASTWSGWGRGRGGTGSHTSWSVGHMAAGNTMAGSFTRTADPPAEATRDAQEEGPSEGASVAALPPSRRERTRGAPSCQQQRAEQRQS